MERALGDWPAQLGRRASSAVGLDNEGETVVAWDAETLRPLAPAIVWSCRRSAADRGAAARRPAPSRASRSWPALPLDPYFSATKIRWLVENDDAVAERPPQAGRLRVGTLDAYVCARLGDGARTEPSTAARTQLQALAAPGSWDAELCELLGVDPAWLPPIGPSAGELGQLAGLPLRALLVDQTASLAGHGCLQPGEAKATYGTGVFLLAEGRRRAARADPAGLLPTVVPGQLDEGRPQLRAGRRRVLRRNRA